MLMPFIEEANFHLGDVFVASSQYESEFLHQAVGGIIYGCDALGNAGSEAFVACAFSDSSIAFLTIFVLCIFIET